MDRLTEAQAHCRRLAARHYENFPTASLLLPARVRPAVAAIYAFARTADDFADEIEGTPAPRPRGSAMPDAARRLAQLADWRRRLDEAAEGRAADGDHVFVALADAIARFDLPVPSLRDLIDAFVQDVTTPRHATLSGLLDYCRRSANPVGRLVLALFGVHDAESVAASDRICTGLQLANFWQDVAVDLEKDRIYVPAEQMARFGVTEDDLFARRATPAFREMLGSLTGITRVQFVLGRPLLLTTRGRLSLWLRFVWSGGIGILDRIESQRYDVLTRRPTLNGLDWARLGLRVVTRQLPHAMVAGGPR